MWEGLGRAGMLRGLTASLDPLQEKAEEVYRLYQNSALSSHPVVALSELRSLCAGLCPDERTFYLLLLQLQKEKRVTILEQNGEKVQGQGDCFWVVSSLSRVASAWRENLGG